MDGPRKCENCGAPIHPTRVEAQPRVKTCSSKCSHARRISEARRLTKVWQQSERGREWLREYRAGQRNKQTQTGEKP